MRLVADLVESPPAELMYNAPAAMAAVEADPG
jgi:hypothetical protein